MNFFRLIAATLALSAAPVHADPFSLDALLDDTASPEPPSVPLALWPAASVIDQAYRTVTIDWADGPDETLPFAAILQVEHARAWDEEPEELFVLFNDGRRVLLEQGDGVGQKVKLMKVWLANKMVEMPAGEGHAKPKSTGGAVPGLSLTAAGVNIMLGRLAPNAAPARSAGLSSDRTKAQREGTCTDCIDKRDVDLIVKTRMDKIRGCYQRELRRNAGLSGHIIVKFVVGRDGGTASAVVKESGIGNQAVEKCVLQQFLLMRFPRPPGNQEITATYPLVFASG
jgi:hypothetical protein